MPTEKELWKKKMCVMLDLADNSLHNAIPLISESKGRAIMNAYEELECHDALDDGELETKIMQDFWNVNKSIEEFMFPPQTNIQSPERPKTPVKQKKLEPTGLQKFL